MLLQLHELEHLSLGLPEQVGVEHLSTSQPLKVHAFAIASLFAKAGLPLQLQVLPCLPISMELQTSCNIDAVDLLLVPPAWATTGWSFSARRFDAFGHHLHYVVSQAADSEAVKAALTHDRDASVHDAGRNGPHIPQWLHAVALNWRSTSQNSKLQPIASRLHGRYQNCCDQNHILHYSPKPHYSFYLANLSYHPQCHYGQCETRG
jgi:hypothetical protein